MLVVARWDPATRTLATRRLSDFDDVDQTIVVRTIEDRLWTDVRGDLERQRELERLAVEELRLVDDVFVCFGLLDRLDGFRNGDEAVLVLKDELSNRNREAPLEHLTRDLDADTAIGAALVRPGAFRL